MASGFTGGGAPDFYTGRSTNQAPHPSYRSNLQGLFLDPSTQIARQQQQLQQQQPHTLIGKRTLSDYQAHQFQNQAGLNGLFHRSVKPRTFQHTSPISPLSPIDFSASTSSFNLPILQQLRPQPISIGNRIVTANNTTQALPGVPCVSTSSSSSHVSEQKIMNDRLQELEKQLLDDDDDDAIEEENDAVSGITNANSEWSDTIQNLISPTSQKPPISLSLSPTSSSSSSSSSSVASPSSTCSKQCVIDAATNISEGKSQVAAEILTRLARLSNPKGNSEERLMSYWVSALKSRVNSVENPPPLGELFNKEHVESTQFLYELSPCFKLGFMAANLAILEATLDESDTKSDNNNHGNKIHVIDFDIGHVGQYLNLLHALSARQNGRSFIVKITAVADNNSRERLAKVGEALRQHANKVGVCFKFKTVTILKLGELTRESLGCEPDESLVVNFAFKLYRMADESVSTDNPRDELLRRVKGLGSRVVILVEQEMNTNTAPFMARVTETCSYYGALFDSIEATMSRNNSERVKIEEGLSRKLGNSVACEGRDRVERCEVFGKWRARMGMAGFELKPLSQNVSETLKSKLSGGNPVNQGFTVTDQNGGVCIGWMGRTLTVASAWR